MASNSGNLNRDLFGSNLYIKGKHVLDNKRNLKVNEASVKTKVSTKLLQFSGLVNQNNCPKTTMNFASYENIHEHNIVKASSNYDFTVESVKASDTSVGIVGVSTATPLITDDGFVVNVCTQGVFEVEVEGNVSVQSGNFLTPSTVEDGSATVGTASVFAVALQSVTATPAAIPWTGDSDFNENIISFPAVTNVSSLCFKGEGYAHSHGNPLTFTVSLWDGANWISVYTGNIGADKEIPLTSVGLINFPNIPSVTQLRLSSNPFQNQSYHDMSNLLIKFGCATVKAIYYKGGITLT
jgi:hypothetical protein